MSLFRYPGGKTRLLPILSPYLDSLAVTGTYAEPFVGGGSTALYVAEKFPNALIRLNDKDDWISSFWFAVSHGLHLDLIEKLQRHPTVDLFRELRNTEPLTVLDKAYYAIFFNRTTFSGILNGNPIGGYGQKSKWTVDCRWNLKSMIKDITEISSLLAGRCLVSGVDAVHFLSTTTYPMYLDPPYYEKGDMLYRELMSHDLHIKLSESLRERDNWVLSYDNAPEISNLYSWANIENMKARYSVQGAKKEWSNKVELIITPKKSVKEEN